MNRIKPVHLMLPPSPTKLLRVALFMLPVVGSLALWGQESSPRPLAYYDEYVRNAFEVFKSQRLESLSQSDGLENFDQDIRDASDYQKDYKYFCLRSNRLFTFATYPYEHPQVNFTALFGRLSDIPEAELLNQLTKVARFVQTEATDLEQLAAALSLSPPDKVFTEDKSIKKEMTIPPLLLRRLEAMPEEVRQEAIARHQDWLREMTVERNRFQRERNLPQVATPNDKPTQSDLPQAVVATEPHYTGFYRDRQGEITPYKTITRQFKAELNADAYAAKNLQETYLMLSLWGNFSDPLEKIFLSTLFQTLDTQYDPASHKDAPNTGQHHVNPGAQNHTNSDLLKTKGLMGTIVPHNYNGLLIPKRYNLILPSIEAHILHEIKESLSDRVRSLNLKRTLLHYLAFQADASLLKQLINEDVVLAALDLEDTEGNTLFLLACKYGTLDTLRVLLELPLSRRKQNINGDTCLHLALENPNPEALLYLIQNLNEAELITALDTVNEDLQTPLLKSIGLTTAALLEAKDKDLKDLFGSRKLTFPSYSYLYYVPLLDAMEGLGYEIQPFHRQMPFFESLKIEEESSY